jgi:hypothetical protein
MVRRGGIGRKSQGNYCFLATGILGYLKNGSTLEKMRRRRRRTTSTARHSSTVAGAMT